MMPGRVNERKIDAEQRQGSDDHRRASNFLFRCFDSSLQKFIMREKQTCKTRWLDIRNASSIDRIIYQKFVTKMGAKKSKPVSTELSIKGKQIFFRDKIQRDEEFLSHSRAGNFARFNFVYGTRFVRFLFTVSMKRFDFCQKRRENVWIF